MSVYVIGDLHLSFGTDKPMDIFGNNWENHAEKIKENWLKKVKEDDTVILPGDFSWATYLNDSYNDFEFLNSLPGKKILLKGNHDYWWSTITQMNKYIQESGFKDIDFLYNNSYLVENKIIVGTRGWTYNNRNQENIKILKREILRLKLSLQDGIQKYGDDKDIYCFIHFPPFTKDFVEDEINFMKVLKEFNVKKCFYGHLHADSHKDAIEGEINGIDFKLISSDYLEFDLLKIL